MRYAGYDECELCNGLNIGASFYVQGCNQRCDGCFNPETWDFDGGKQWNESVKKKFLNVINKPYIKRVTILGGEPLENVNMPLVFDLITTIKKLYPDKTIWLYTGKEINVDDFDFVGIRFMRNGVVKGHILSLCDYIVDGAFIKEQRDLTLAFRGSTNQRIIDVKETLKNKEITLLKE
jgi:anaerobic ribonucleoside-triphosphate reductase activating protein